MKFARRILLLLVLAYFAYALAGRIGTAAGHAFEAGAIGRFYLCVCWSLVAAACVLTAGLVTWLLVDLVAQTLNWARRTPDIVQLRVAEEHAPVVPPGDWRDRLPRIAYPYDDICQHCGAYLMYSARQRGNGLCGPCTRAVAAVSTRTLPS